MRDVVFYAIRTFCVLIIIMINNHNRLINIIDLYSTSASEVTTIWRYTNVYIIIIIIITRRLQRRWWRLHANEPYRSQKSCPLSEDWRQHSGSWRWNGSELVTGERDPTTWPDDPNPTRLTIGERLDSLTGVPYCFSQEWETVQSTVICSCTAEIRNCRFILWIFLQSA